MKSIGFILLGHENGGRFFDNVPDGVLCPACRGCMDASYSPASLDIENFHDVSATLDNRLIFSKRVKDFFQQRFDVQVVDVGVWQEKSLYHVRPNMVVPFNALSRGTRFVEPCETCGSYRSIVGATPAHLAVEDLDERCFYRTDILFGSYEEKAALAVIGRKTADDLQDRGVFRMCVQGGARVPTAIGRHQMIAVS